jgi:hypothetical protein
MENSAASFLEIQRCLRQVGERVGANVITWRQDPHDSRHLFLTARLWFLPRNAAPVQLEAFLPALRTQL